MMKTITEFDRHFIKGIFTESSENIPLYNFKKMSEYCKDKNIHTQELSERELEMFHVKH
ncbi:MAG: hypothetical protein FWH14_07015 [Oscillospiraceae bacterium]|nr:hypothetical protein [Oscillospiraceae bacterium]